MPIDLAKKTPPRGEIFVIAERCKECALCIEFCPTDVLEVSEVFNARGYKPPRVAAGKASACVACNFCEEICPELAIFVKEVKG